MSSNIRCPNCNRTFETNDELTGHFLQIHIPTEIGEILRRSLENRTSSAAPNAAATTTTTTTITPDDDATNRPSTSNAATCPVCNRFCVSSEDLRQHYNACHAAPAVYTTVPPTTINNFYNNITVPTTATTTTTTTTTPATRCTVCRTSYNSAETLLQHSREVHPERIVCTICGKNFQNSRSLNFHRHKKHPDRIRSYAGRRNSRPVLPPPRNLRNRRRRNGYLQLTIKFLKFWRTVLTMGTVREADNLPSISSRAALVRDVLHFVRSRHINYRQTFHCFIPTTVTLEEVRRELSNVIEEIFPHQCQCFCNLLIPLAERQPHFDEDVARHLFETVLLPSRNTKWHHHCIVVLKEDRCSMRTIQRRMAALLKRKQPPDDVNDECLIYKFKKIKTFDHLLNAILYIMGRRSEEKVNTHMFHAMGYYITSTQRKYILDQCRIDPSPDIDETDSNSEMDLN